jgi:hypothetical protein
MKAVGLGQQRVLSNVVEFNVKEKEMKRLFGRNVSKRMVLMIVIF